MTDNSTFRTTPRAASRSAGGAPALPRPSMKAPPARGRTLGIALGMGLGMALAAPMALGLSLTAASAQTAQPGGADYSDEMLEAFVRAALAVGEIEERYNDRLMAAADTAERDALIEEAGAEMVAAVEGAPGITVEEYVEIAQAAQTNPQLGARIVAILEEGRAE